MISLATKYPNVYIDTSAYTCTRYPAALVDYLRGHGRRKVLFGSNHPFWPAADCLAGFDTLGLDAKRSCTTTPPQPSACKPQRAADRSSA
jgi:predicted TIM-barrel fold metal-dependent hydrolase